MRVPENDTEYANRVKSIEQKLDVFKTVSSALTKTSGYFEQPTSISPTLFHKLGTVIYKDEKEVQRIQRNEYLLVNKSLLTKPTTTHPVYILEEDKIYVYPSTIDNPDITVSYIKKPKDVVWGYSTGTLGQYLYASNQSTDFELHPSEQTDIILNILMYAGVVVRDPSIMQTAAGITAKDEANEKS